MHTYFRFNNNNSMSLLPDVELTICHIDSDYSSTAPIFNRELIKTDFSHQQDYRRIIGSKFTDGLTFKFALIKTSINCTHESFTLDEIETVTTWLYGNGISQKLEVVCDEIPEYSYYYKGVFTNIERVRTNGTIAIVCTFETDSPYLYINRSLSFSFSDTRVETINVRCPSTVYPKITFTPKIEDENVGLFFENRSNTSYIDFTLDKEEHSGYRITIDAKNGIISNGYGIIPFSAIGWNNVDSISWMYLINGENTLLLTSPNCSCDFEIEWEDKILGGVLNEFTV